VGRHQETIGQPDPDDEKSRFPQRRDRAADDDGGEARAPIGQRPLAQQVPFEQEEGRSHEGDGIRHEQHCARIYGHRDFAWRKMALG